MLVLISAYKDHRNGIKKPKRSRYPSMKGVCVQRNSKDDITFCVDLDVLGGSKVPSKPAVCQEAQQGWTKKAKKSCNGHLLESVLFEILS